MSSNSTVTCSFSMDRAVYNAYKSIVVQKGDNVKSNLIRYMQQVIEYGTPNAETIFAIKEVERMKKDPSIGKAYLDVDAMMQDLLDVQSKTNC